MCFVQQKSPLRAEHESDLGVAEYDTCTADSGELEGIALAGKRSLPFAASLRLMRRA
jgi:hypothetical protein